jgi:hypothetical protein
MVIVIWDQLFSRTYQLGSEELSDLEGFWILEFWSEV